ncbi:MAG: hypothetical protein C4296_03845 [Gemmataceae bacterium]
MVTLTESVAMPGEAYAAIRQSLARLRRALRWYICVEGIAATVVACGLWFWVVALFDRGLFALAGVDYVRDAPGAARGMIHVIFWLALAWVCYRTLGVLLLSRLARTLGPSTLALILERRFPDVLGERLITAIELGDLAILRRYGFSESMIRQTAEQAADKLAHVPIRAVFDLKRLFRRTLAATTVAVSLLGSYVVATDFTILALERNLLGKNRYWPPDAVLQVTDCPQAVPRGGDARLRIRAWRWAVADPATPLGWRPLTWDDLHQGPAPRPRELQDFDLDDRLRAVLPPAWTDLTPDDVDEQTYRLEQMLRSDVPAAEAIESLRALGRGALLVLLEQLPPKGSSGALAFSLPFALPEDLSPGDLAAVSELAKIPVGDLEKWQQRLQAPTTAWDAPLHWLALYPGSIPLTVSALERLSHQARAPWPPMVLTDQDKEQLPTPWRHLPAYRLLQEIERWLKKDVVSTLGKSVLDSWRRVFADLAERAGQRTWGRYSTFRRFDTPDSILLEYENVLSPDELAYQKVRRGQPQVRRSSGQCVYQYELRKLEHPVRFRACTRQTCTPWHTIALVPLPALVQLERIHEEPGYLYESVTPVVRGPIPVALDGDVSRFEVPEGTRVTLRARASKPLLGVRVLDPIQPEDSLLETLAQLAAHGSALTYVGWPAWAESLASSAASRHTRQRHPLVRALQHTQGSNQFVIELGYVGREDVPMLLEMTDTDRVRGSRRLILVAVPDRPPEFAQPVQYEIVHRERITHKAIVPFSGHLRDDHGLTAVQYEVRVCQADGQVVRRRTFPLRSFQPLEPSGYERSSPTFAQAADIRPGRVISGAWGRAWAGALWTLSQPGAGMSTVLGFSAWQNRRELRFELPYRPGSAPVLEPGDEFLDTLLLRDQADAPDLDVPLLPFPYKLIVRVLARDNRQVPGREGVPSAPQVTYSAEAFEFTVVAEEDVLLEAIRQEEDLRDRFQTIVGTVKKVQATIRRTRQEWTSLRPEEVRRIRADSEDAVRTLQEAKDSTDREIAREFRQLYRELLLNRVQAPVLERMDVRICRALEDVLSPGRHFDRAVAAHAQLVASLEQEGLKTPVVLLDNAADETERLVNRLEEILSEMRELMEFSRAVQEFREKIIRPFVEKVLKGALERRKKLEEQELGGEPAPKKP